MTINSDSLAWIMSPLQGEQRKPTVILLTSTLLILIWAYFGSDSFFREHLAVRFGLEHPASAAAVYRFVCGFVLLGLIPMLIVKFGFREKLRDYGVGIGLPFYTFRSIATLLPLFIIIGLVAGSRPGLQEKLLSNPDLGKSMPFALHACFYLLFYFGWEFHFRGFLLHGLAGNLGMTNAILIQVMASSIVHLRDPAAETFGAVAGGILWGLLAYRTKSILSGILQHAGLGLATDLSAAYY